jgi:hypothetical protein
MELRNSLRLFRAVLITGSTMSVAAAGHVLGGGVLPAPGTVAVLAALLLVPVAWLAARELSFLTLLGVLGAGQLLLHEAFISLSAPAVCLPSLTGQMPHHGQAMGMACSAAEPASMSFHLGTGSDSPLMLAGHVLALLGTAWLLRRGEEALWRLLAWLRPLVQLPQPARIVAVRQRTMAAGLPYVPAPWRNLRTDSLRGPPAAATPCAMP